MYSSFIQLIKPIIEICYFIAGIIVSIAAVIALRQIKIMKHTVEVQSKRDALKITSEQCVNYMTNIIELQNEFYDKKKANNVVYLDNWIIEVVGDEISLKHKGKINFTNFEKLDYTRVSNAMEAFATYFTSKVADEVIAFNTLGITYVETTESYLPFLKPLYIDGYYHNIIQLYLLWKKRFMSIDLQKKQKSLEAKINKCNSEVLKPIGVE